MEVTQTASREVTDEALMQALTEGKDAALAELMNRWEPLLKRFLYRLMLNAADAEDLTEETFVRIYQARDRFGRGARFSPWAYSIASNLAKNRWRWRNVRRLVSLDQPDSQGNPFEPIDPQALTGPATAESAERIAAVRAAIAALPHELRTVVILADYEEQSHAEIAAALGCTPKAVETRLYRAREKLRKALSRWLVGSSW